MVGTSDIDGLVSRILSRLDVRGETLSAAESLTGGMLSSSIVDVPGASSCYLGAVVTYATPAKHSILEVNARLLDSHGPVYPAVATQMAEGARKLFSSDWSLSTTGVAGPDDTPDGPAGKVYIGIVGPDITRVDGHRFGGSRSEVREQTVLAALELLHTSLEAKPTNAGNP